jgi:ferredoxin
MLALRHLQAAAPAPVDLLALPPGAPFGRVVVDTAGCTLCLACVAACPTGALRDNPERPMLSFVEDACVQCGLCRNTCPEKVISLEPRLNLGPDALSAVLIKEEEPCSCIRCGKPFGIKSSVDRIVEKLSGKHWMFPDQAALDRLRMCADCRVVSVTGSGMDPYAGPARPVTRTTEDYLREAQRDADIGRIEPKGEA